MRVLPFHGGRLLSSGIGHRLRGTIIFFLGRAKEFAYGKNHYLISGQERQAVLEGGCFCGAVRYKVDGALGRASACHCSRCRKAFSGASSAYAEIPDGSKFSWVIGEDQLTECIFAKGWGLAFCRICGSTLCGILDRKVHGVTLGTIDGDPGVQIEMHTFVGSKAPWDHIAGSAPQFKEEYPNSDTFGGSPMTPNE